MTLYTIKNKDCYIIDKLPQIGLLNSLGMREGAVVSIMSKQPLGGPVVVKLGGRCLAISKDVAEQITVKEVS
ncbi:ferrous iron transport protein A [Desulfitispora alkaliphila]|uniref:FeoA family protein n=1 Tax=Desulfitispora alkaliphila TaxID=622674 RepID=UPI003D1FF4CC